MKVAVTATLACTAFGAELGSLLRTGHANHADANFGGAHMERTFTMYTELPTGAAALAEKGWTKHNTVCDPQLGFVWTEDPSGPTKSQPMKLYTTMGGQPAGVGTTILGWGESPLPAAQWKWATAKPLVGAVDDPNVAQIDVAFRKGDIMCSGKTDSNNMGDTLIVNPKGNARVLHLTEAGAIMEGWHKGACFDGMGTHRFLDTSMSKGQMSWKAENLFPVVTMYHEGAINAIFFATTINQVSIPMIASNEWEPKALSNPEMCKNFCDKDCTFSGLTGKGPWSTAHVYFRDHTPVVCDTNLECSITWPFRASCCPKSVVV